MRRRKNNNEKQGERITAKGALGEHQLIRSKGMDTSTSMWREQSSQIVCHGGLFVERRRAMMSGEWGR